MCSWWTACLSEQFSTAWTKESCSMSLIRTDSTLSPPTSTGSAQVTTRAVSNPTHRQYLPTIMLALAGEDFGEQYVQKLAAEAQQLGHEVLHLQNGSDYRLQQLSALAQASNKTSRGKPVHLQGTKAAVAVALHKQVVSISRILHTSLADASDPMPAALHAISVSSLAHCLPAAGLSDKCRLLELQLICRQFNRGDSKQPLLQPPRPSAPGA